MGEMRAFLARTLVSSPLATHLSWHVRDRSLRHSRCARSLRGRSFLRLLRPTSRGMCGTALCGIRDARAPCGDARFFASCDPPLVACTGPLFVAFEMRALLAGTLVTSPSATHLSWHVRGRSLWHSRCARSLRGRSLLRLLRPTSRGTCGAALWGIRDARAPCGDARYFASCDPPLVACAGSVFGALCARSLRGRSFLCLLGTQGRVGS